MVGQQTLDLPVGVRILPPQFLTGSPPGGRVPFLQSGPVTLPVGMSLDVSEGAELLLGLLIVLDGDNVPMLALG